MKKFSFLFFLFILGLGFYQLQQHTFFFLHKKIQTEHLILKNASLVYHVPQKKDIAFLKAIDEGAYFHILQNLSLFIFSKNDIPWVITYHFDDDQTHYVIYLPFDKAKMNQNKREYTTETVLKSGVSFFKMYHPFAKQYFFYAIIQGHYILSSSQALLAKVLQHTVQSKKNNSFIPPYDIKNAALQIDISLLTHEQPIIQNFATKFYLQRIQSADAWIYSGMTHCQKKNFLYTFFQQKAKPCTLWPYIISSTIFWRHYTFSDIEKWWQALQKFWQKKIPFQEILRAQQGEIACLNIAQGGKVLLWKIHPNLFLEALKTHEMISFLPEKDDYYQKIYPLTHTKNFLWQPDDPFFVPQYCMFLDDQHVVFATKRKFLEQYLQSFLIQKMTNIAAKNLPFENFLLPQANMSLYIENASLFYKKNSSSHKMVVQWNFCEEKKWYTNVVCQNIKPILKKKISVIKKKKEPLPTDKKMLLTDIQAPLVMLPQVVENHRKKFLQHFFVQDAQHVLYFMEGNNQLLWKKTLDGPVISPFFSIDFYRNKKIQYLFSTKNKVYIIDYHGCAVENYPLVLPEKIPITAINLLDYDQNKQYRIAIAAQNKMYLYDQFQKILPCWHPKVNKKKYRMALQHIRKFTKDYLLTCSIDGCLQVMNRKGHVLYTYHITPGCRLAFDRENIFVLDTNGLLKEISLQGKLKKKIHLYQPNANDTFTFLQDQQTQKVYLLRRGTEKIDLLDLQGKVLFTKKEIHTDTKFHLYNQELMMMDMQGNVYCFDLFI